MWKKFWSFPWQPCAQVNDSTTWVCFLGESVPLEQGEGGIFSVFIAKYFAVGFFFSFLLILGLSRQVAMSLR